ncbi:MAG TPA: hypothetical protein VH439_16150 [Gemmatimonadales bacterium]|jgi:hypothetical protein
MIVALLLLMQIDSLSSLRNAKLTESVDTFDTFTSEVDGRPQPGRRVYVVRTLGADHAGRWELVDAWYDSTGHMTARQATRTAPRALRTELVTVRADDDSASMLVSPDHVTAWVVPSGGAARFYDGDADGERYDLTLVIAAIAKRHPAVGSTFRFPAYTLYGTSPIATQIDSIRVVRRDTLTSGSRRIAVVVLQRPSGGLVWVDETTGSEVASRGNAGPGRWWWHIKRGVAAP